MIAWAGSSVQAPAEIFASSATAPGPFQITSLNAPVLKDVFCSTAEPFEYPGAGGTEVHGWIVKPPNFRLGKRYPLLVMIHGGPQGAWLDSFHYRWNPQPFAAAGYVVFMPNPRGSTGYGQKFVDEISGDWGGKPYEDIWRGIEHLIQKTGWIDEQRVGALGGSYGGYMVNWILGHSKRFKALLSHAGMFDLPASWGTTEELWFPEWEFGKTPWENREGYEKWSPHLFAQNFKTPTLVVHGEEDYRVGVHNALELFSTLQRKGVPSKLLYFPDEGHFILKPQNSRLWYETAVAWFGEWLKP